MVPGRFSEPGLELLTSLNASKSNGFSLAKQRGGYADLERGIEDDAAKEPQLSSTTWVGEAEAEASD